MCNQRIFHAICLAGVLAAMTSPSYADDTKPALAIIPVPAEMHPGDGQFVLAPGTPLVWRGGDPAVERLARDLASHLALATGTAWEAQPQKQESPPERAIQLAILTAGTPADLGPEGYTLRIDSSGIRAFAQTSHGLFYAVQTLRQMLASAPKTGDGVLALPAVSIVDKPRYGWRGMHLDVCRHFMPKEFVKKYLDLLAYHKFNVFHWHLTDDQGWRIEIKKYPKLTEVAAWRNRDGERYGGFYTQEDIREIVAYAADRFITVVPEIEMPGHSQAALAAYPELSCTGGPHDVQTKWGIFKDVFCAGNDETFAFLEGVLAEVIGLFPSEFIHVGGDECPKDRWKACPKCQARIKAEGLADEAELQSYFVRRVSKFLTAHNRRLVGWDEILEGGLAPSATVMSWRGTKGGIAAARQGHDAIMTPHTYCYLDYSFSSKPEHQGATHASVLPLEKVYQFEPTPAELTPEEAKHILGGQGNVWTERMPDWRRVEWMVFPRACAIAEAVWSPRERRDYADFRARLQEHEKRLIAMDVNVPKLADIPPAEGEGR